MKGKLSPEELFMGINMTPAHQPVTIHTQSPRGAEAHTTGAASPNFKLLYFFLGNFSLSSVRISDHYQMSHLTIYTLAKQEFQLFHTLCSVSLAEINKLKKAQLHNSNSCAPTELAIQVRPSNRYLSHCAKDACKQNTFNQNHWTLEN